MNNEEIKETEEVVELTEDEEIYGFLSGDEDEN